MKIFAFDIGLRNLAAVVISKKAEFTFAGLPDFKTYLSDDETADAFKLRALQYFLKNGWNLEQWDLIDVSDILDREVKNVKRLSDVSKAIALADSLQALEDRWFRDAAPDIVCVETQHNANAIMRGVSMGTLVFFRRSFPETALESKSGGHKLKICDALGIAEGAGLVPGITKKAAAAEKKELKEQAKQARLLKNRKNMPPTLLHGDNAAAGMTGVACAAGAAGEGVSAGVASLEPVPALVVGGGLETSTEKKAGRQSFRRFGSGHGHGAATAKKKEKYEDNKLRAVLAVEVLMPGGHPVLTAHMKKKDDLCDVLLMALWVLWCNVSPRAPTRRTKKK